MKSCEFVTFVTSISCAIARCSTPSEIEMLSAVFNQISSTLATIAVCDNSSSQKTEEKNATSNVLLVK